MTLAEMEHQLDRLVGSIPASQIKRVFLTGCGGGIANLRQCEYVLNQHLEEGQVSSAFCANLMVEKQRRVDEHALVIP